MADAAHSTGAPAARPPRPPGGHPMLQISPTDPLRLARTIPLSMWPEHVREQLERRRKGMARALLRLEDLREAMVEKLDALTIDPDLEPSLGAAEYLSHLCPLPRIYDAAFRWAQGASDDREADGDRLSACDADLELSLGSSVAIDQRRWANACGHDDREQEHDGREPQCEDEGAQCDDEGAIEYEEVPDYGVDQTQRLQEMR